MSKYERDVDVAVIGGGLAGLAAADELRIHGMSFVVLEGSDRLGGRTATEYPELGFLDMGAEFIGPLQPYALHACQRFGLDWFKTYMPKRKRSVFQHADGKLEFFNGMSFPETDDVKTNLMRIDDHVLRVQARLEEPWEALNSAELDQMSAQDWIDTHMTTEYGKEVFAVGVRGAFSVEPSDLSALYLLFYSATAGSFSNFMNVRGGGDSIRLARGTQGLVDGYTQAIGAENVKLRARVQRVAHTDTSVVVETTAGTFRGRRGIVAMSPVKSANFEYHPTLPPERLQLSKALTMGSTIKGFVVYDEAWWRDKYSGYVLSACGPACWIMDNTSYDPKTKFYSHPSLMIFIAGAEAERMGALPLEERKRQVLEQIGAVFGDPVRAQKGLVGQGYYARDWANVPLAGGCPAGHFPPGVLTKFGPWLRAPIGAIHWAGSETEIGRAHV